MNEITFCAATLRDVDSWMKLVRKVRGNFPGLETELLLSGYRETVCEFAERGGALCAKDGDRVVGVLLLSTKYNMLCFLAVDPAYRRRHIAASLISMMYERLDPERDIIVSTFREGDEKGVGARALYTRLGFVPGEHIVELGYPNQRFTLKAGAPRSHCFGATLKVIIGANGVRTDGWISTEQHELDISDSESMSKFFQSSLADAMLMEHVFEHLSAADAEAAAKNCFDYLKPGGYIRIAVPDANYKNAQYQKMARPGGLGDPLHPSYTHRVLYDKEKLTRVFENAGFIVEPLEFCGADGAFHYMHWNEADGRIGRSLRFDTRNANGALGTASLIIDAKKPLVMRDYRIS